MPQRGSITMNKQQQQQAALFNSPLHVHINDKNARQRLNSRRHQQTSTSTTSTIDKNLSYLYKQLFDLEQSSSNYNEKLKLLLEQYHFSCLHLKARYKIEQERIEKRFENEQKSSHTQYQLKKCELKELLIDRLKRKRRQLIEQDTKNSIDINSKTFDYKTATTSSLISNHHAHSTTTKAYNFRQRRGSGGTGNGGEQPEEEFFQLATPTTIVSAGNGISSTNAPRKRLVGAFSLYQMPKWTIKEQEQDDDLKMINKGK